jgi:hypothetical protein
MSACFRLSWSMKSLRLFLVPLLDSLEFAWQVSRYALIFVSAFFRRRTSLACEMVAFPRLLAANHDQSNENTALESGTIIILTL